MTKIKTRSYTGPDRRKASNKPRSRTYKQWALKLIKIPTTAYLEPWQDKALTQLSRRTRVPKQVYMREGLEHVLFKHGIRGDRVETSTENQSH